MTKKIVTKKYGETEIIKLTPIYNNDELFLCLIYVTHEGYGQRIMGIIDKNKREIVPFEEEEKITGIRVINDNIIIVDCKSEHWGLVDQRWTSGYGSLLLMKENNEYRQTYISNASIIFATNNMLLGANYLEPINEIYAQQLKDRTFSVESFEYNYQLNHLVNQETIYNASGNEVQAFLYSKLLSYPEKALSLTKYRTLDNTNLYKFTE